ncbi:hypothetical protein EVAR_23828_1 [Eumeta japonica]|uniref:Uncharacterized protein n=1 Tax=Eumeta variegata TaxID=151549 RepID=A0A4C1VM99_EUMVA|nr:hypothetical protein EVAR_23828_1 [Eumeta japonica]
MKTAPATRKRIPSRGGSHLCASERGRAESIGLSTAADGAPGGLMNAARMLISRAADCCENRLDARNGFGVTAVNCARAKVKIGFQAPGAGARRCDINGFSIRRGSAFPSAAARRRRGGGYMSRVYDLLRTCSR